MAQRIYLDYNASTPIAAEVADAMRPFLSGHWSGSTAREAVERARAQVAGLLGCAPSEVVLTSGGTEANNHAIKGVFHAMRERGNHIISTRAEHPAVIEPCRFLERLGARVTYVGVDRLGQVNPEDVRKAIGARTILISVMHANNEVGTIMPIAEIGRIAHEHEILFHTDAAQSMGKIPVDVGELDVDLLSVAGHKLYAPKGVGALYIRGQTKIEPLIHGAGHESGRRAGTENVLLDVGLGAACAIAGSRVGMTRIREIRDFFWDRLREMFGERVVLNGHPVERLPNTLNVSFVGEVGAELLTRLGGVAASTGSACHSGGIELSPVLDAMQVSGAVGLGAVRFSLGRSTTRDEIEVVLDLLRSQAFR